MSVTFFHNLKRYRFLLCFVFICVAFTAVEVVFEPVLTPVAVAQEKTVEECAKAKNVLVASCWLNDFLMLVVGFLSTVLGVVGKIFNAFVYLVVINWNAFYSNCLAAAINPTWALLRDLINITFIFGLLWTAIQVIIGFGGDYKKRVGTILLGAFLINFSLLFAQIMIDMSNAVTVAIYNVVFIGTSGGAIGEANIGGHVLNSVGVVQKTAFDPASFKGVDGGILLSRAIFVNLFLIVFIICTIFVVITIFGYILQRLIVFIQLMILAPIGIAGGAVPMLEEKQKAWWSDMKSQAIFLPLMFLAIYISLKINNQVVNVTNVIPEGANVFEQMVPLFIVFAISIGALFMLINYAKSLAESVSLVTTFGIGKTVDGWANKMRSATFRKLATPVVKPINGLGYAASGLGGLALNNRLTRKMSASDNWIMKYSGLRKLARSAKDTGENISKKDLTLSGVLAKTDFGKGSGYTAAKKGETGWSGLTEKWNKEELRHYKDYKDDLEKNSKDSKEREDERLQAIADKAAVMKKQLEAAGVDPEVINQSLQAAAIAGLNSADSSTMDKIKTAEFEMQQFNKREGSDAEIARLNEEKEKLEKEKEKALDSGNGRKARVIEGKLRAIGDENTQGTDLGEAKKKKEEAEREIRTILGKDPTKTEKQVRDDLQNGLTKAYDQVFKGLDAETRLKLEGYVGKYMREKGLSTTDLRSPTALGEIISDNNLSTVHQAEFDKIIVSLRNGSDVNKEMTEALKAIAKNITGKDKNPEIMANLKAYEKLISSGKELGKKYEMNQRVREIDKKMMEEAVKVNMANFGQRLGALFSRGDYRQNLVTNKDIVALVKKVDTQVKNGKSEEGMKRILKAIMDGEKEKEGKKDESKK